MVTSELANKIVEALNGNAYWPSRVDIPTDEDIHVGPLVFRYGGGPKGDAWYIADDPGITPCSRQGHAYEPDEDPAWHTCSRPDCGYRVLTSSLHR